MLSSCCLPFPSTPDFSEEIEVPENMIGETSAIRECLAGGLAGGAYPALSANRAPAARASGATPNRKQLR
jgi:hypothetical protein